MKLANNNFIILTLNNLKIVKVLLRNLRHWQGKKEEKTNQIIKKKWDKLFKNQKTMVWCRHKIQRFRFTPYPSKFCKSPLPNPPFLHYHHHHTPHSAPTPPFFTHTNANLHTRAQGIMLGKRERPPFRKTRSISGINVAAEEIPPPFEPRNPMIGGGGFEDVIVGPSGNDEGSMAMMPPEFYMTAGSGDSAAVEVADFLKTCGLCNRSLPPGRDIYMYR